MTLIGDLVLRLAFGRRSNVYRLVIRVIQLLFGATTMRSDCRLIAIRSYTVTSIVIFMEMSVV